MGTYVAWFPRYALGNRLMFLCRVFSPAVGRGSSELLTFLTRRTQRVNLAILVSIRLELFGGCSLKGAPWRGSIVTLGFADSSLA